MNRIIRVFPRKTSYTPMDRYAFVGMPPMVLPEHEEVHVSCTFTWDREAARELAFQWEGRTDRPVKLGGPAFGSPAPDLNKIKCFVLIGQDMDRDEARLRAVYEAGAMPFAQLYRDFSETKTEYSAEWTQFARMWQRPAATVRHMEDGTDFRDFHT